jgi:hypothetical protein
VTHVRRRTFGGSCEVLAVTPLPRFLEIGDATTRTYFSSPTPNIPIEIPTPTLLVMLLLSMGSSKDPHKVSHFLPPESIATGLGWPCWNWLGDHYYTPYLVHLSHKLVPIITSSLELESIGIGLKTWRFFLITNYVTWPCLHNFRKTNFSW